MTLKDRALDVLEEWVNLNSHHQNREGVKAILERVCKEATTLGLTSEWVPAESTSGIQDALSCRLPATFNLENAPEILLVTHADTVFSVDSPFQTLTWSDDRKSAIGPGVIDDKGGILVALLTLERLATLKHRPFSLRLLCMPAEEIGSPGHVHFLKLAGSKASMILGFEPSLSDGSIIHSRRGNRWVELTLSGPGGHAGRDAGKVKNPLQHLAAILTEISQFSRPENDLSVTPTVLRTDTEGFNVIPSQATARLDIRYDTNESRDQLFKQLAPLLNQTQWSLHEDCPAMPLNTENLALGKAIQGEIQKIETLNVRSIAGTGSSDSNYAARPGIPMIDGLGPVGSGLHSIQETIQTESLFTRSEVLSAVIQSWFQNASSSRSETSG